MARARLIAEMLLRGGRTVRYGPHRSQRADLNLPAGPGPHPVMALLHGGSWRAHYGKRVMRGLVGDLCARGWATWNVEYRRVGDGGGWPQTFLDVAAAIDHLPELDAPLDLERVSLLGHSAGGHLALWAAGRGAIAADMPGHLAGPPPLALRRVIALAAVAELSKMAARVPDGAVVALMGGAPEEFPQRYQASDPILLLPTGVPALLVHGTDDATVSIEYSRDYASAAREAGDEVELIEISGPDGGHRSHIDPRGRAWRAVTDWLEPASPRREPAGR